VHAHQVLTRWNEKLFSGYRSRSTPPMNVHDGVAGNDHWSQIRWRHDVAAIAGENGVLAVEAMVGVAVHPPVAVAVPRTSIVGTPVLLKEIPPNRAHVADLRRGDA
jgi:hypothetical protein